MGDRQLGSVVNHLHKAGGDILTPHPCLDSARDHLQRGAHKRSVHPAHEQIALAHKLNRQRHGDPFNRAFGSAGSRFNLRHKLPGQIQVRRRAAIAHG